MASGRLSFGLSEAVMMDFQRVFEKYPEIAQVLVFGSRAKGTFKAGSDIDLAILAPAMDDQRFTQLWNELDGLPLVFKMDILHWDRLADGRLKTKIQTEGRVFYPPHLLV